MKSGWGRLLGSRWMLYGPVLLLVGIVAAAAYYANREYRQMEAVKQEAAKPAPVVDVLAQTYPGKLRAQKTVAVAAPIEGTLESLEVTDGEEVYEGQLLGRIVNSSLEAHKTRAEEDLERARGRASSLESQLLAARLEANRASAELARVRSEAELAQRSYDRQRKLFQEGAAARKTYEKAEGEYQKLVSELKGAEEAARSAENSAKVLQAAVDEARQKLSEATNELEDSEAEQLTGEVKAPVSGLLVAHRLGAGEEVTRDIDNLFEIATDLTAMEAVVEVPEAVAGRLKAGGNVFVQIAEAGEAPLNGTIREVSGQVVVVEFLSPTPAIKPGLTAQIRFLNAAIDIR